MGQERGRHSLKGQQRDCKNVVNAYAYMDTNGY